MSTPRDDEGLIPPHGGHENLKTWQLADLLYDITVRFCDKYVDPRSRTHDQMVQAARSGSHNLEEGSIDSAVSKKFELKLTGVSRGSLRELRRDYKKFLSHRDLPEWPPNHPALLRFKALRCNTLRQFRRWVAEETRRAGAETKSDRGVRPCQSVPVRVPFPAVCAANGALSLLNLCLYLVERQLEAQARAFEQEGGFTERLYRVRSHRRSQPPLRPPTG
jgi:four helix bundle suffix protein